MRQLGNNLKTLRKVWHLSQDEFGRMFGLNRGNINSYEGDKNDPSMDFLLQLEEISGIMLSRFYKTQILESEVPPKPLFNGTSQKLAEMVHTKAKNDMNNTSIHQASTAELYERLLKEKDRMIAVLEARLNDFERKIAN
jgi:transcriptional regulator with XRE-family HTH domain